MCHLEEQAEPQNNTRLAHRSKFLPLLRKWGPRGHCRETEFKIISSGCCPVVVKSQLLLNITETGLELDAEPGSRHCQELQLKPQEGSPHFASTFHILGIHHNNPSPTLAARESVRCIFCPSSPCHSGRHTKSKGEWNIEAKPL